MSEDENSIKKLSNTLSDIANQIARISSCIKFGFNIFYCASEKDGPYRIDRGEYVHEMLKISKQKLEEDFDSVLKNLNKLRGL